MNIYTSVAITNIAIISVVGFGIYITHEWWPLLALLFMVSQPRQTTVDDTS